MKPDMHRDFPEVKGKTVEMVELISEPDYYAVSVRFEDKTVLTFSLDKYVVSVTPVYSRWAEGDETILKEYPPVHREFGAVRKRKH